MTTRHSQAAKPENEPRFVLHDLPEREPEDMTSFDHLTLSGSVHHIAQHLRDPETTIVAGESYRLREKRHAGLFSSHHLLVSASGNGEDNYIT